MQLNTISMSDGVRVRVVCYYFSDTAAAAAAVAAVADAAVAADAAASFDRDAY